MTVNSVYCSFDPDIETGCPLKWTLIFEWINWTAEKKHLALCLFDVN